MFRNRTEALNGLDSPLPVVVMHQAAREFSGDDDDQHFCHEESECCRRGNCQDPNSRDFARSYVRHSLGNMGIL